MGTRNGAFGKSTYLITKASELVTPAGWTISDDGSGNLQVLSPNLVAGLLFSQPSATTSYLNINNETNGDGIFVQNVVGYSGNAINIVNSGSGHGIAGHSNSAATGAWGSVYLQANALGLTIENSYSGFTSAIFQAFSNANMSGVCYQANVGISSSTFTGKFIDFLINSAHYFTVNSAGLIGYYAGILTTGIGVVPVYGKDVRTDVSSTDGSALTLYTAPAAGLTFRVTFSLKGYSGTITSAIYTVTWTENALTKTATVSISALSGDLVTVALPQPDNGTNITGQLTTLSGTSPVVDIAAIVEQVA